MHTLPCPCHILQAILICLLWLNCSLIESFKKFFQAFGPVAEAHLPMVSGSPSSGPGARGDDSLHLATDDTLSLTKPPCLLNNQDRMTGNSRGFGFVTFENSKDAEKVIGNSSLEMDGRQVVVEVARAAEERPSRPTFGQGEGGNDSFNRTNRPGRFEGNGSSFGSRRNANEDRDY